MTPSDLARAETLCEQSSADAQAAWWWLQHCEGALDDADTPLARGFAEWLAADPAHREAWQAMLDTAQALAQLPADVFAAHGRPAVVHTDACRLPVTGRTRRAFMTQAACAAGVIATAGLGAWWMVGQQLARPQFALTHATARGQLHTLSLPDGSQVHLDTDSEVAIALYADRREVRLLRGQALFEVTADWARPFQVDAGMTRVTVLGTRFQVRHVSAGVDVAVAAGRVRVRRRPPGGQQAADGPADSGAVLGPGDALWSDAAGYPAALRAVAVGTVAAWRDGRLSFDNTPLSEALAEFARYGDTGLVLGDERVASLRVTGSFEIARVQDFARALPRVLPVALRRRDGRTEIIAR
ncbi:FecR family protein [Pseudothauera hydrothermalis]|uniref:FecR family protein n=1 Tax=Pseudothauera hydrothermalis TaxID=2184083 RepID=UPI0013C2F962|nr:FecR domain-containing protein [Pseudothauera hydrothermalis]